MGIVRGRVWWERVQEEYGSDISAIGRLGVAKSWKKNIRTCVGFYTKEKKGKKRETISPAIRLLHLLPLFRLCRENVKISVKFKVQTTRLVSTVSSSATFAFYNAVY